jgi:hypothetical protein
MPETTTRSLEFPILEQVLNRNEIALLNERFLDISKALIEASKTASDSTVKNRAELALEGLRESIKILQELFDLKGFMQDSTK